MDHLKKSIRPTLMHLIIIIFLINLHANFITFFVSLNWICAKKIKLLKNNNSHNKEQVFNRNNSGINSNITDKLELKFL